MKVKFKNSKGITLVALVVTIIVLIILAGVSINLVMGENGIITTARGTKTKQKEAEIKEKIGLDILDSEAEALERNEKLEKAQIEDIISKYGELQEDKDTIILRETGTSISLLDIYNGTIVETGSYTANKAKIELLENQLKLLQEQLEDANKTQEEKNQELEDLKGILSQATATKDDIASGKTAYLNGELVTGTMEKLNLADETEATATADNITEGKTAWVNGQLITGTGTDNTTNYNNGKSSCNGTWALSTPIIVVYSSGQGTTTFNPLCRVTMSNGNLTVSYSNTSIQYVSFGGKTFGVDPCETTIRKIN